MMGHVPGGCGEGVVRIVEKASSSSARTDVFPAGPNPSALCWDRSRCYLFAANEGDGTGDDVVCVGRRDAATGEFTSFMPPRSTKGVANGASSSDYEGCSPCYLTTDLTNQYLIAANYGTGTQRTSGLTVYKFKTLPIMEKVWYAGMERLKLENPDGSWRPCQPNEQEGLLPTGERWDRQECCHFHCVEMRRKTNEQEGLLPTGERWDRQECCHFHCVEMRRTALISGRFGQDAGRGM